MSAGQQLQANINGTMIRVTVPANLPPSRKMRVALPSPGAHEAEEERVRLDAADHAKEQRARQKEEKRALQEEFDAQKTDILEAPATETQPGMAQPQSVMAQASLAGVMQPGMMQPGMMRPPPPGCPPGGEYKKVQYCGPKTEETANCLAFTGLLFLAASGIGLVCLFGACRTYQQPKDEEELYVLVSNGTFTCYNLNGTLVTDQDLPGMKVGGTIDDTRVTQQSLY